MALNKSNESTGTTNAFIYYFIHNNIPFSLFVGKKWCGVRDLASKHNLAVEFQKAEDVRHAVVIIGDPKDISKMYKILEEAERADFGHRFGDDNSTQAERKANHAVFNKQLQAKKNNDSLKLDDPNLTSQQRRKLKKRAKRAAKCVEYKQARQERYQNRPRQSYAPPRSNSGATPRPRRSDATPRVNPYTTAPIVVYSSNKPMRKFNNKPMSSVKSQAVKFPALPGSRRVTHVAPEVVQTNYEVTNEVAQRPPLKLRVGQVVDFVSGIGSVRGSVVVKVIGASKDNKKVKIDLQVDGYKRTPSTMIIYSNQPNDPSLVKIVMQKYSKARLQEFLRVRRQEQYANQQQYEANQLAREDARREADVLRQTVVRQRLSISLENEYEPAVGEDVLALGEQEEAPPAQTEEAFEAPPQVTHWHAVPIKAKGNEWDEWDNAHLASNVFVGQLPKVTLQRSLSG